MAVTRRRGTTGTRTKRSSRGPTPEKLLASIRDGSLDPVVLITGRDHFSREALLEAIRAGLVTEGFETFDAVTLYADTLSGADVVSQADVMPMGGRWRLLLVRRADRFKDKDAEAIAAYADAPSEQTRLVLVCDQARAPVISALKDKALRLDFPPPRDYQLARWLEAQAARLGIGLETDAARALADLMGENYIAAMSELQRAALGVKGRSTRVTRGMIEELAAQGRDTNPFHLGDAVLSREPVRAIGILRDLYDAGGTGYAILGMLESQLRRFLKMRSRVDAGEPARSVVQSTSPTLPPSIKARLTRQLESFDGPRLREAFRIARETDRAIKSGAGSELGHMESLVWRVSAL